ncbi:MAG: hypothetical protein K6G82_03305 [Ruminococcus sp.]|nr:hypothetical protein [Ruminococcus sp.]
MPRINPRFESWKAACAADPIGTGEFHKKANNIVNNELKQLCKLLEHKGRSELADRITELTDSLIEASTPAAKVKDTNKWAASRRNAEQLCQLLSDNVNELGELSYSKPGLGDSLFHFMGEFAAREQLNADMDETYRRYARNKNKHIDELKAKGLDTSLKKTDETFSESSRYANKVFMQNVQALKEGYDDKGLFGKGGSSKEHEEYVDAVTDLSMASAHIVNAPFGDKAALEWKKKAMTRAKKAAEKYVTAKRTEAGKAPDDTEWRPLTPMGRKRYESALSLIIGINDEFERLDSPATPDPLYDGDLPSEELDFEQPFQKITWVIRMGEIPSKEPGDPNARDAFINEYKRCKIALEIIEKTKDLPASEKTPEAFRNMFSAAMNDKNKQAELDAKLGDDVWKNMSADSSKICTNFYMNDMFTILNIPRRRSASKGPDPTEGRRNKLSLKSNDLAAFSDDLKDKGLFGKRGSSDEHGALVNTADDLLKLTRERAKSEENYEKLRGEHIEALKKAKAAAETYISEKKKNGWGDTSSPDWRPLSPMGKLRYEAALKILEYADEHLEAERLIDAENEKGAPELEDDLEESRSERSESMDEFDDNVSEISENELNDAETNTLDNNIKDIEGKNDMIDEVGDKLEQKVEPEPGKDNANKPADLDKNIYLGWIEDAGQQLNSPNPNWDDAKMNIMAGTASVLFINQLENAYTKKGQPMPNISQQTFTECILDTMNDPAFNRTFEQFGGTSFGALNRVQISVLKDGGKDFFAKFRKNQLAIENENKLNEKIKNDFQKKAELNKPKTKKFEHTMQ